MLQPGRRGATTATATLMQPRGRPGCVTAMTEVTVGCNHGFSTAGSRLKLFLYTVEAFLSMFATFSLVAGLVEAFFLNG